jgi:TonB family protein
MPEVEFELSPVEEPELDLEPSGGDVPDVHGGVVSSSGFVVSGFGVVTRIRGRVVPVPVEEDPVEVPVVSGPSRAARLVGGMSPRYPERQRLAGREATVVLVVQVDEAGRAVGARVIGEANLDFARSAVEAVMAARYEPSMDDGRPVPSEVRVRIEFRISP